MFVWSGLFQVFQETTTASAWHAKINKDAFSWMILRTLYTTILKIRRKLKCNFHQCKKTLSIVNKRIPIQSAKLPIPFWQHFYYLALKEAASIMYPWNHPSSPHMEHYRQFSLIKSWFKIISEDYFCTPKSAWWYLHNILSCTDVSTGLVMLLLEAKQRSLPWVCSRFNLSM